MEGSGTSSTEEEVSLRGEGTIRGANDEVASAIPSELSF